MVDPDFDDAVTLSWLPPAQPGASAGITYDVLRSPYTVFFLSEMTCVESDGGADTSAIDPGVPSPGGCFFYLVRAQNGCLPPRNLGSLGFTSDGTPREAPDCP